MNENIFEETMNAHGSFESINREPNVVTVDAEALQDLCEKYTEYRQALAKPGDPVRFLTMTGDVMAAVREIVVNGRLTTSMEEQPQ